MEKEEFQRKRQLKAIKGFLRFGSPERMVVNLLK
jgi:hypothetical protein